MEPIELRADELRIRDTIEVWWQPRRDTITALRPYDGPLECLKGGFLADFAINRVGMTLEPHMRYRVVSRIRE